MANIVLIMIMIMIMTTMMIMMMVMMKHRWSTAGLFCQIVGETIVPRFAPLPSNSLFLSGGAGQQIKWSITWGVGQWPSRSDSNNYDDDDDDFWQQGLLQVNKALTPSPFLHGLGSSLHKHFWTQLHWDCECVGISPCCQHQYQQRCVCAFTLCDDIDNYDGDDDGDGGAVNITVSNVVRVFVRLVA